MLVRKLKFTERANQEIEALFDYLLGTWGPDRAEVFLQELWSTFDLLLRFPDMGQELEPDVRFLPGTRRFVLYPNIILYHADSEWLTIDRVVHGKQDLLKPHDIRTP